MTEPWRNLPDDCWAMIFSRLDQPCLEPVSLVSKQFLSISNRSRTNLNVTDPSIQNFPRYLQRFPNLKKINLARFHGNLNQALLQITESVVLLEELDISGKTFHSVSLMNLAGSSLRNLKVLHCSSPVLNDEHLTDISSAFPMLEELDISGSYLVTDKGVTTVSYALARLRRINLRACFRVFGSSLVPLSSNCPHLEHIAVGTFIVGPEAISFVLGNSQKLSSLTVCGINLSEFNFSTKFSSVLSSLTLINSKITDEVLELVARANLPLKTFMLILCKDYTFAGVSLVVEKYPCLESLALDGAAFLTDGSINQLSRSITKLKHLSLNFCTQLSDLTFMTIMDVCASLNVLKMGGTSLGTGYEHCSGPLSIKNNRQLIMLNIPSCTKLSNHGLKRLLSNCPSLHWLDCNNCFLEEEVDISDILENCSGLKHLNIGSCRLVKFSNKLEEPILAEIEQLVAPYSGINDEVLEMVGRTCLRLTLLDLSACESVTSKGVKAVATECTRLRYLNLSWCEEVNAEILDWVVSTCGSLRHLISPSDSYPEDEQIREFLHRGCLVDPSPQTDLF